MEDQVLKIHVAEEAAGQSVERFLRIGLGLSRKQISRLKFREEGIRLNGLRQRVTQTLERYSLQPGGGLSEGTGNRRNDPPAGASGQGYVRDSAVC